MPVGLRRDLGALESYATLIGIPIGAGIFKVTSQAWALTGPSVILGYVILAPAILATSVAYSVFLSTPLGRLPGGEYTHLSRTFGGHGIAFVGAWLKIISYIGALAFLASAFGDYVNELLGRRGAPTLPLAVASLVAFYAIHVAGVRWFGRIQVWMCALLGLSLIVLIAPAARYFSSRHQRHDVDLFPDVPGQLRRSARRATPRRRRADDRSCLAVSPCRRSRIGHAGGHHGHHHFIERHDVGSLARGHHACGGPSGAAVARARLVAHRNAGERSDHHIPGGASTPDQSSDLARPQHRRVRPGRPLLSAQSRALRVALGEPRTVPVGDGVHSVERSTSGGAAVDDLHGRIDRAANR